MTSQTVTQRNVHKLSDGRYRVSESLYLVVRREGKSRSWVFRYRIGSTRRDLSLGSASVVSLASAKEETKKCQILIARGLDPKEVREKRKASVLSNHLLTEFVDKVFEEILLQRNLRQSSKKTYRHYMAVALEKLEGYRLNEITPRIIYESLKDVYDKSPRRTIAIINLLKAVYEVAKREKIVDVNPAIWKDGLDQYFQKVNLEDTVEHYYSFNLDKTRELVVKAFNKITVHHLFIVSIIFTASRRNELITLRWQCVDLENRVISILPEFRKDGVNKVHFVPISKQFYLVLKYLWNNRRDDIHVFWGPAPEKIFCKKTAMYHLKSLSEDKRATFHGFRSTFRVWAAENNVQYEVAEKCLMHTVGNAVYKAYQRSDFLEQRREVMQRWADTLISVEEVEKLLK